MKLNEIYFCKFTERILKCVSVKPNKFIDVFNDGFAPEGGRSWKESYLQVATRANVDYVRTKLKNHHKINDKLSLVVTEDSSYLVTEGSEISLEDIENMRTILEKGFLK